MNQKLRSFLLWISVPLCIVLAVTGLSVFWPGIYWREKPASVAGAVVSDILDLCLILPTLVVTTVLARRGSLCALLVWAGTLGYLCYNFPIYVFDVHFNAMFPAYCAVMGLSFYGLMGVRKFLVPVEIAKTYSPGAPRRSIAAAFILLSLFAGAHELKEIVLAIRAGQIPAGAAAAGQFTDPIHVLDLCFLLPALVIAAVMLLQRKEMGFTLAPVLSVVLILISIEVIAMIVVPVAKGFAGDLTPAISFAVPGALFAVLLGWYLYPKRKGAEQAGVLS
ncbi:MAG: hypothetical protein ABSH46_04115 [Bryobacteraceae bacterium]|jgi:hypothetical protein